MKRFMRTVSIFALSVTVSLLGSLNAQAASPINLGTASDFAILAGSGITNTGTTTVTGDVGSFPTTTQTGFGPGADSVTITGTNHFGDATTQAAKDALTTAYTDAATRVPTTTYGPIHDLGGATLTPGVYNDPSSFGITGTLTLDGGGDPNAVWIFQAGSTLITASDSIVNLINDAQACNVFWQVGSSATLGTGSLFRGTIMAADSITDNGGSTVHGRLLAQGAAVTLKNTAVTKPTCLAAPQLTVTKTVTNDHGGTKVIADFPLFLDGVGVTSGVANTTTFGLHTVSETTDAGYTSTIGGDCAADGTITLVQGTTKTCTITNDDKAAHLIVIKHVVNDSGTGSALASAFSTTITGVTTTTPTALGVESPGIDNILTTVGSYSIDEGTHAGYDKTLSADCSGTIALGETKTCTITNDDTTPVIPPSPPASSSQQGIIAGTINVVKIVINDNGGTKTMSDFPLFVNGTLVVSGETNSFAPAPTYEVTEKMDPQYTRTFSGDCDPNGRVALHVGENKFCIITNNDIGAPLTTPLVPPLIALVKVPNPLALPAGPGPVTYTYILRNIGTIPVNTITLAGDTCDPIILTSGDTNANSILDVNETWVHTCSKTLTATHTNTVVATGMANGLTATDIASATVIVGASVVPPLIHVTKIPDPLTLLAGGGMVTYTETVSNPGMVPLGNIRLTDDKCSPVQYISGDTNKDSKLDPTELWVYTCKSNLTKTTTNTASVTGEADGLAVRDLAIVTVVVAHVVPGLPDTGLKTDNGLGSWIIASVSFIAAITLPIDRILARKRLNK